MCGPTHNWDHWQLILVSPREQNSHCCGSSLETAGLPFLGLLAGWAAAVPKSHKSSVKLILIANFCYIKVLKKKKNGFLCVALDSFHALFHPSKCLVCESFSTVKIQAFPNSGKNYFLRHVAAVFNGKKILYFFLFYLYS